MKRNTTRGTKKGTTKAVMGLETKYHGTEHGYLRGQRVRICAVIKGGARPDFNPDADDTYITDDETLAAAGGVTADDRVEVAPWIEAATPGIGGCEGPHWSFVASDARAVDLACWAELATGTAAPEAPAASATPAARTR